MKNKKTQMKTSKAFGSAATKKTSPKTPKKAKTKMKTKKQNVVKRGRQPKVSAKSSTGRATVIDESIDIVNELCDNLWWERSAALANHLTAGDTATSSASAPNFRQFDVESKRAAVLFTKQEALFNTRNSKDKDAKWLSTMMRNGTMSDRVAASTLAVQQNPIFSTKVLLSLMAMAMKNNQREAQLAITALKDLFINNLMPSDRKLKYFVQQPVSHPRVTAKVPEVVDK